MENIFIPIFRKELYSEGYQNIVEKYFFDLYELNSDHYHEENLSYNKKSFFENYNFIISKKEKYKYEILKQLKELNYPEITSYYEYAIDFWLIHFLSIIKIRFDKLIKLKRKYHNLSLPENLFDNSFNFKRTEDFLSCFRNDSIFNIYIYQKIAKKLEINLIPKKISNIQKFSNKIYKNKKFKKILIFFILRFLKPNIYFNVYLNSYIEKIKIFIKERSIFFDSSFLKGLYENDNQKKIALKINENDKFDVIANLFLDEFYPEILVPNKNLINQLSHISKNTGVFHSSVGILSSDEYRILSNIIQNNDKIITFQHGSGYNLTKCNLLEDYEKRYSKVYDWTNSKSFKFFFIKYNSKKNQFEKKNNITFFSSINYLNELRLEHNKVNFLSNKQLILNTISFYDTLREDLKYKIVIRNHKHSYNWDYEKLFKNNLGYKFYGKFHNTNSSVNAMYNSKIFVTDFFSTAFFEALVYGLPCFAYFNVENFCFNDQSLKLIKKLQEKNIIFVNAIDCSNLINEQYNNIKEFWSSNDIKNTLSEFKEYFFGNNYNSLT